jgi:sugar/nucleoside kinase (ribokinase family)
LIIAIGNPVYDYIKTPRVDTKERVLSGCSTNAALALAKLGEPVRLIGAVGDDYKARFTEELNTFGIQHEIIPSHHTGGFSLVYYDEFGNRTLDLLGQASDITGFDMSQLRGSKAVLIGPILGEVSLGQIDRMRKEYDGLFFCDPQGLLRGSDESGRIFHAKPAGIEDALGNFDIVKPNELEGRILTGIDCRDNPYEAAKVIKSWGPKIVIVTLAELGSIIYDGDEIIDIPPVEVDLVDATGAGDVHMAGFVHEYLKTGGDLRAAGCFAAATSSIMIEHVGPDFLLKEAEVRRRQQGLMDQRDFKVKVAVNKG